MIMFTGLLAWEYHDLHMKNEKVCNKTRSRPASLPFKGQGTEHTTVKWSIVIKRHRYSNVMFFSNATSYLKETALAKHY